jgi:hypothetical protein
VRLAGLLALIATAVAGLAWSGTGARGARVVRGLCGGATVPGQGYAYLIAKYTVDSSGGESSVEGPVWQFRDSLQDQMRADVVVAACPNKPAELLVCRHCDVLKLTEEVSGAVRTLRLRIVYGEPTDTAGRHPDELAHKTCPTQMTIDRCRGKLLRLLANKTHDHDAEKHPR